MPPGPIPDPNARRRNAPTIPSTNLPASGRKGRAPNPPKHLELGDAGSAWWAWAWHTPQAAAWSTGDLVMIGRRASLEDDLAALGRVESLDALDVLNAENMREVRRLVDTIAGLATGKLAICREARELDDRLGLTPKGLAALRWRIVADTTPEETSSSGAPVANLDDRRARSIAS